MNKQLRLFLGCFIALVATAFGFIVRALILKDWQSQFNLSYEQLGNIQGAGLYPFAISIILFSLIVDKIGYGRTMVFAFACHTVSAVLTISAPMFLAAEGASAEAVAHGQQMGYWMLYVATFIFALGNGTVEAVINPVVATVYARNKTHWLNILHAGWPGGLVFGGLLTIGMSVLPLTSLPGSLWQWQVGLVLIPTILYGVLLLGQKFPVQERVAAGVSYRDMLGEFGAASCLIVCFLLIRGVDNILGVFDTTLAGVIGASGLIDTLSQHMLGFWAHAIVHLAIALVPTILFALWIRRFGRPMFVVLLLIMFLLATTELGTDTWIASIMTSVLANPQAGGLVLVYTSFIMFVLRFFAGPIVHRISPLGLLATSALIASIGLFWLSNAGTGVVLVFIAATCYGLGKTFFWPTTLGVVSEQYPKGGALLLNGIAGVGMIAVGVLGNPLIGAIQDRDLSAQLKTEQPAIHAEVIVTKPGILGESSESVDPARSDQLQKDHPIQYKELEQITATSRQSTLGKIAFLPAIMFLSYLGLILYFRSKGGYKAEVLTGHGAKDEEFTGGVEGPVE